jgi:hypothetical protein
MGLFVTLAAEPLIFWCRYLLEWRPIHYCPVIQRAHATDAHILNLHTDFAASANVCELNQCDKFRTRSVASLSGSALAHQHWLEADRPPPGIDCFVSFAPRFAVCHFGLLPRLKSIGPGDLHQAHLLILPNNGTELSNIRTACLMFV